MAQTTWGALRKTAEDASKPLPKDWYEVAVEKAEATTASTGKPMVKLVMNVLSGPHAGNRKIWNQIVFSPDSGFALQMFFKNLAAFGLAEAFFDTLPEEPEAAMQVIANALVGARARALIGPRAYQGTDRDNVEELAPSQQTGSGATPTIGGSGVGVPSGPPVPQAAPPVPQAPPMPQTPPTPGSGPASPPQLVF